MFSTYNNTYNKRREGPIVTVRREVSVAVTAEHNRTITDIAYQCQHNTQSRIKVETNVTVSIASKETKRCNA